MGVLQIVKFTAIAAGTFITICDIAYTLIDRIGGTSLWETINSSCNQ